jgi:hypothetical protein
MEVLAPLLGMQVPEHIKGGGPPPGAAATIKSVQGDGWEELMQVGPRGLCLAGGEACGGLEGSCAA